LVERSPEEAGVGGSTPSLGITQENFMFNAALLFFIVFVAYKWAKGIENMKNLHPDYKGEDFP
jgi:hypothetical protein